MAQIKISGKNSGKPVEISASELLERAIQKRDELNVFIRLLLKSIQGRESTDA
jgi:hypothetical protein